jgi:hypothetical protein
VEAIVTQNPFETRSFSDRPPEHVDPREVDFARVGLVEESDLEPKPTFLDDIG